MNIKRALLVLMIVVAVISSLSVASAGLFDDILGGETQDNVVEIENITFNTTDSIKFVPEEFNDSHLKLYVDDGEVGYTVYISNTSEFDDSDWDEELEYMDNFTSDLNIQEVNGVDIFNMSVQSGPNEGQMRYGACVMDNDLKTYVIMYSPDPNETAKMASTLEFR